MSGAAPVAQVSWAVGAYTATLSIPRPAPGAAVTALVEWSPRIPEQLTEAEEQQYRAGRDRALQELGEAILVAAVMGTV